MADSEHRCLAGLHLVLAQLQESAISAAHRQALLDTALGEAARNSRAAACLAAVRVLVGEGAHPGEAQALQTFLRWHRHSVWEGPEVAAVLSELLRAGADHSARDSSGFSPLELAAQLANAAAAKAAIAALLAAGAVTDAGGNMKRTPLHFAGMNSTPAAAREAIVALLAAGADPMASDADGKLAIDLAGENANSQAAKAATRALGEGMAASWQRERQQGQHLQGQLQQAHDQLESLQTCTVCMAAPRTTAFSPCGHFAFCSPCATALAGVCSVCRAEQCTMLTVRLP